MANKQTFGQQHNQYSNESSGQPYWQQSTYVTPYSQLISRYANSTDDLNELAALLNSWNLGDLYNFFVQQHLYVGILKHMPKEMAQNLFQNSEIPLGVRVEFFFQWSQWIKTFDQPIQTSPISGDNEHPQSILLDNQETIPQPSSNVPNINECAIDLCKILNSNTYGTSLLNTFKKTKVMNENLRKLMCESVLQYCIENKHDLSVADASKLAQQICKVFPGEELSYYHLERKNAAPLGKLYSKYRNWKNSMNRKSGNNSPKKRKISHFEQRGDEESHIRQLKHDFHALNHEERIHHWKACSATRLNNIKDAESNTKQIIDVWPQYKTPAGYRLIESDFEDLHGKNSGLLDNIGKFSNTMLNIIFPRRIKDLKGDDKIWFDRVVAERSTLSEDAVQVIVFYLLQLLLPPSRVTKKSLLYKDINPIRHKVYSIDEARNSFMRVCTNETEYRQYYDAKVSAESSVTPYISVIGSLENPQYYMVDFENISFKLFHFGRALDVCFKAYYVFNIAYPETCQPMWDFINKLFYGLPCDSNRAKPGTNVLVNDIKLAMTENETSATEDSQVTQMFSEHASTSSQQ